MKTFDVAVIGCGIVGAAAAYELSRYRLDIVVLERENDVCAGTTKANSAILHAGYDPEPGTLMAKLNVEGAALAGELCRALDVPYRQCGSLVLAFSEEERAAVEELYRRGIRNGVQDLRVLERDEVLRLEPALSSDVVAALHAPTAAIVSPWEYGLALAEAAVMRGTQLHLEAGVTAIAREGDAYRLSTPAGEFCARYVLNAAGLQADTVHNLIAKPTFTVRADRGEYYLLDKSEGGTVSSVVFQCPTRAGKGTLVSPTVHGNLIVGPNNEPPREREDVSTTREGLEQVAELARRSVPDLDLRRSIRNFAGNRAVIEQEDFLIAEAPGAPGFIDLAGIKSPGLTAAPAIARLAAELLRGCGLALEPRPQLPPAQRRRVRFHQLPTGERRELVAQRPAYGRVICRCETVTEGEILDALRAPIPPRSVDGVKRRCSPGMGRCQGGFCGPRIVELLARELGVAPETVPQDGAGTQILVCETKRGPKHV